MDAKKMLDSVLVAVGREKRFVIRYADIVRVWPPAPNHRFSRLEVSFQEDLIELSHEDTQWIEQLSELSIAMLSAMVSPCQIFSRSREEEVREVAQPNDVSNPPTGEYVSEYRVPTEVAEEISEMIGRP